MPPVLVAVGLLTILSRAGRGSHRRAGDGGVGARGPSGPFPSPSPARLPWTNKRLI